MLGTTELLVILVIVFFLFGASKLPGIAESLGKSIKIFKRASSGEGEIDVSPKKKEIPEGKEKEGP